VRVRYPTGRTLQARGKSDARGHWRYTWLVKTSRAGRATVTLEIGKGSAIRRYTLHFTVT
jgi:hypothetical protein